MIDFKKHSIKKLASAFSKKTVVKIEKDYAAEFAEYFGAKPKRSRGSDDEFNHHGILENILRAVKSDTDWTDVFTPKQKETINMFRDGEFRRLNILDGSVRSGKTYISLIIWALMISTRDYDERFIMVGRTLTTLKRNCLELLQKLVGDANFSYSLSRKEAELFGRKIYLEGADNALSEDKIRGMTLAGAYCDEITLLDEDFFRMLLSRLSVEGAFLLGTTNPDAPTHWLYKNYIKRGGDGEVDLLTIHYLIDDNTFLDKTYVENIKKEYVGVFYDRFILGLWKAAEGVIYKLLADNAERFMIDRKDVPALYDVVCGEDFGGNKSGHSIVCSGTGTDGKLYFTKARFKKATGSEASELARWSADVFKECYEDTWVWLDVYADSAEQILINTIRKYTKFAVHNSLKRSIIDRIRFLCMLLGTDRVRFVRGETEELVEALCEAVWDSKQLEDTRVDNGSYNNDIIDAAEYSFEYKMDRMVNDYVG